MEHGAASAKPKMRSYCRYEAKSPNLASTQNTNAAHTVLLVAALAEAGALFALPTLALEGATLTKATVGNAVMMTDLPIADASFCTLVFNARTLIVELVMFLIVLIS